MVANRNAASQNGSMVYLLLEGLQERQEKAGLPRPDKRVDREIVGRDEVFYVRPLQVDPIVAEPLAGTRWRPMPVRKSRRVDDAVSGQARQRRLGRSAPELCREAHDEPGMG